MALKALSTSELQAELARREKGASKLSRRRDKLIAELKALETEIAALGGSTSRTFAARSSSDATGKRRRARNDINLPEAIARSMDVRAVVSPKEAAELVLANGFKTHSANFGMMVSNALAKDSRFKRLGRGQYERVK